MNIDFIQVNWFHLVMVYIIANAASKLLQKYAFKMDEELDPSAFSAFFLIMVGILTIPFLLFENIEISNNTQIWLVLLLSSIFYTTCMFLFYHALKNTEISQVETIATTRTLWLMLLGVIFFQERLSTSQYIGIFIIFLGLIIIYWNKGSISEFKRSHLYIMLYALIISSAYALDKFLLSHFSVVFFQVMIYITPGILTLLFIPNTFKKMKYFVKSKKITCISVLCCTFQMISTLALYGAYEFGGELSLVGPLAQTSVILTISIGIIFFKERWNLTRKIIGITFILFGITFIRVIIF
jgi:drug/metabolite transporter (DMT)-like permease